MVNSSRSTPARTWAVSPWALVSVAVIGVATIGCGSEPEFAEQPTPDAGPPPPPPPAITDAGTADAAPTGTQPCDGTMTLAVSSMFEGRRKAEAPNMEPEGSAICHVVPEGQEASTQTIMLQPGYCYTILGQALPTVTEIDLKLVLDPVAGGLPPALAALGGNPLLAQDTLSGNVTSIGAKKDCYRWAFPAGGPTKLLLKARTGSGPVAAQIYKKKVQ
jgi:hypothetical protein